MTKKLIISAALIILLTSPSLHVQAADKESLQTYVEETAAEYGICPELIKAIIEKESDWNPDAYNGGCIGLMQINPKYQVERMERLSVTDLYDPYSNILIGIDYIAELAEEYQDLYAVLMFYNAGYSAKYGLRAWEAGNYSNYAVKVSERAAELERLK